jgi:ligand-binding sensor domain-containing protein
MAGLGVHDIAVREGRIWIATERGVASRDLAAAASGRSPEWQWAGDRQFGRALALAATLDGIWVGGDRGVEFLPSDGGRAASGAPGDPAGVAVVASAPARALVLAGDTLWIGTDAGLGLVRRSEGAARVRRPTLVSAPSWFQRPVIALARSDTVLAVATDAGVGLVNVARGSVFRLPGDPDFARVGRLLSVAIDGHTIWVGGPRGAIVVDRATGLQRAVDPAGTLGEPVLDIALQPDFAWLATPAGVVRVRRLPDGGVR